jgi:hypothetical protein
MTGKLTNKQKQAIVDLTERHGFGFDMLLSACKCADCGGELAEWSVCAHRRSKCAPAAVVPVCVDCVRRVLREAL